MPSSFESPRPPPPRAVRGTIIDTLVSMMKGDDNGDGTPIFTESEITVRMRSAAASEELEKVDEVPWWLRVYVSSREGTLAAVATHPVSGKVPSMRIASGIALHL